MATTTLGNKSTGSIIKLKENGTLVDFYVAKHDYESSLNGAGRTLVVRKDTYDDRVWDSGNVNAYASSDLDSWFNSTYKNMLDADIRSLIGTTKIRYTPGNGNNTVPGAGHLCPVPHRAGAVPHLCQHRGLRPAHCVHPADCLPQRERHHTMDPLPAHELHLLRRLSGLRRRCLLLLLLQLPRVPPRFHSPLLPLCER